MVKKYKEIGERLREIRRDFQLSQEALARELEVSLSSVVKWESGRVLPSTRAVLKLAERFGVSPTWLLLGNGPKFILKR